jgi:indoleamine 2,3-dioxygenase
MTINDFSSGTSVYDIDPNTGFLPRELPLEHLPLEWELWEQCLDTALALKLSVGSKHDITAESVQKAASWRESVRQLPILSIDNLRNSDPLSRRAHLVLSFIFHIFIHTHTPTAPIIIPSSLGVPLISISNLLDIPPDVTYSDTVLYNWRLKDPSLPLSTSNFQSQVLFTGTLDEEEFYLASTRIEFHGVEALEIARLTMRDLANGDLGVVVMQQRLERLKVLIMELKTLLMDVRKACRPTEYYNDVRPWLSGQDSDPLKRKWQFEGLEEHGLPHPPELSGPSAGQSSLIHALDAFLGIHHPRSSPSEPTFQDRMRRYMPRRHRAFLEERLLNQAKASSLREFIYTHETQAPELLGAYNGAVRAMKEFRDGHMIIAAMYIVNPSRKAQKERLARESGEVKYVSAKEGLDGVKRATDEGGYILRGTGGTDLVQFLKSVRVNTVETLIK